MHDPKSGNLFNSKLSHMELSTITPPKLSFDSLPIHRQEPSGLATPPPFRIPIAIPFIWEEEPGRPRKESIPSKHNQKPLSARSLKLPPRLVTEELKMKASTKNSTSPTSVLDVPCYFNRSRSFRSCYFFDTGSDRSHGDREEKTARKRESSGSSCSSISSSTFDTSSCGYNEMKESHVKITRIKRRRRLIDVSVHATSSFLIGIYKSLRQVIPWHRT